ncbi:hypothetical protein OSI57_18670, partial [Mycobacterium ulcerans]
RSRLPLPVLPGRADQSSPATGAGVPPASGGSGGRGGLIGSAGQNG